MQVLLLSKQNQGLREGVDAVETEMTSLHGVIDAKDEHVQKLRRERDRLRRDMKRLHVRSSGQSGQIRTVPNHSMIKKLKKPTCTCNGATFIRILHSRCKQGATFFRSVKIADFFGRHEGIALLAIHPEESPCNCYTQE